MIDETLPKSLASLIAASALDYIEIRGPADAPVSGLAYDSRLVKPGWLFFALPGIHTDGNLFIDNAIENGAVAIVHRGQLDDYRPGITYIEVDEPALAMSALADRFYDQPSRKLGIIGVTGTEGKSTVTWLIAQLMELAGMKTGFISTVDYKTADRVLPNPEHQTTPEAIIIQEKLAAMVKNGISWAVIESSSHGLSPKTRRLYDIAFDIAIMTNVRHEHLEFHGTYENYRDDKARLFSALDRWQHRKTVAGKAMEIPSFGIVCADDKNAERFSAATCQDVYCYTIGNKGNAELRAEKVVEDARGSSFELIWPEGRLVARINLTGLFNVENVLAAILVVWKLGGKSLPELVPLLERLRPVKGRMRRIERGQDFELIVDYAHTPSSFEAVLPSLKKRSGKRKLIAVFGSGGERDTQKRPEQGRIASESCDIVILSDEDPRGEEPMAVLEEIAAGVVGKIRGESLFLIPDRRKAIEKAISLATTGDIVILLGKGHENSIIYKDGAIPWDEEAEAEKILMARNK